MDKTKILAIVPYEGLRDQLLASVRKRDDILLSVYIGELAEGAERAKAEEAAYDVILSRGGTAESIARISNLPVVWVRPTIFDMLRVFRLVQSYAGKYAIVGFPDITQIAEILFDIIQLKGNVVTITGPEQVESRIAALKGENYTMIIGDVIAVSTAKRLHMNGILITSGEESVEAALNEAVRIHGQAQKENRDMRLIRSALSTMEEKLIVYREDRSIAYSTWPRERALPSAIVRCLSAAVPRILQRGSVEIKRALNGCLYKAQGFRTDYEGASAAMFILRVASDIPASVIGLMEFYEETDGEREPLIDNIGRMNEVYDIAHRFAKVNTPVIILREEGIDDLHIARSIHSHSARSDTNMLILDMALINMKRLKYILRSENSPLNEIGKYIVLRNIGLLDEEMGSEYRYYVETTDLNRRNRMIYVLTPDQEPAWRSFFMEQGCLALTVPPLRERKEDIMSLATLCLNTYSYQSGLPVIGFDAQAEDLLTAYSWPRNVEQIRRVIQRAVLMTKGLRVSGDDARAALQEEETRVKPAYTDTALFKGTLSEITARVVGIVLDQEKGNRTATAARLGISRSTLWRLLGSETTRTDQ